MAESSNQSEQIYYCAIETECKYALCLLEMRQFVVGNRRRIRGTTIRL